MDIRQTFFIKHYRKVLNFSVPKSIDLWTKKSTAILYTEPYQTLSSSKRGDKADAWCVLLFSVVLIAFTLIRGPKPVVSFMAGNHQERNTQDRQHFLPTKIISVIPQ